MKFKSSTIDGVAAAGVVGSPARYISATALMQRWGVSRTQVSRLCDKGLIRRISLSATGGEKGRIAYLLSSVEEFEHAREFRLAFVGSFPCN
jgi:hypothetical protein